MIAVMALWVAMQVATTTWAAIQAMAYTVVTLIRKGREKK